MEPELTLKIIPATEILTLLVKEASRAAETEAGTRKTNNKIIKYFFI